MVSCSKPGAHCRVTRTGGQQTTVRRFAEGILLIWSEIVRRPLRGLTSIATALHHAFELAAGAGLVFQPYVGLRGATVMWSVVFPGWFVAAARGSARWDRPLAFLTGLSIGGAAVHFTLWPWEMRAGLPLLTEAEGLEPGQLPAYNVVLYGWALAAIAALAKETPRGARRWALAGMATAVPLRFSARHHFTWIKQQGREHPAWWNRALADKAHPYNDPRRDARADEGARLESV
jgi:hypothetical protein